LCGHGNDLIRSSSVCSDFFDRPLHNTNQHVLSQTL